MNRYGQQAMQHWQNLRPEQLAEMTDPQKFFTELGEDLEQAVERLAQQLAGTAPADESYLHRVRRLTMARVEAEGQVLRSMVLTAP